MMRFANILILSFSVCLFLSCTDDSGKGTMESKEEPNVLIEGNINGGKGLRLLLERRSTAVASTPVDSTEPGDNGKFSLHFRVHSIGFYRLSLSPNNAINLIISPGEHLHITADAPNLGATYTVQGSQESSTLMELTRYMQQIFQQTDSLKNAVRQHQINQDYRAYTEAVAKSSILQARLAKYVMDFIDNHPHSLASIVAIGNLDPDTHFEYYKKVVDSLASVVSNEPFYTILRDKVKEWSAFAPGALAPDIILDDMNGKPLSLHSLRGKVVLLDFWASWCRPCRMENPKVVEAYKKYKDQGFTVYSVSLDGMPQQQDARGDWLRAIEHDGLLWKNHVSDLKGWNSMVVPLYRIDGIPMTFLLDREGKIAGKNLRGKLLEDKIEELLKQTK